MVDDGLATGATMLAAIKALRQLQPARQGAASLELSEEKLLDALARPLPWPWPAVEVQPLSQAAAGNSDVHDGPIKGEGIGPGAL